MIYVKVHHITNRGQCVVFTITINYNSIGKASPPTRGQSYMRDWWKMSLPFSIFLIEIFWWKISLHVEN
jgi:hypothetical protein